MADDIFDKMWSQLGRIYEVLHDGLIPRANDGSRQPVGTAFREALGMQDTGRLSDTAAMDLREEADAIRNEQDQEARTDRRPTAERLEVEAPPVIEPQQSVGSEIRSAIREIGPAITGAIGGLQRPADSSGGATSGDLDKGSQKTEHESKAESQLDRIGDGIDRIIELLSQQIDTTREAVAEAKETNKNAEGWSTKLVEVAAILTQRVSSFVNSGTSNTKSAPGVRNQGGGLFK